MPPRAKKVCRIKGCPNIATHGALCDKHYKEMVDKTSDNRPNSGQRGYDSQWTAIRDNYLKYNPLCVDCGRLATDVDHIIPLSQGGTHDWDNLAARCHRDHSKKTATQDGGFGNKIKYTGNGG